MSKFPHTPMDLESRLSEALGGHRRALLAYMAQEPSNILSGQGKLKESLGEGSEAQEIQDNFDISGLPRDVAFELSRNQALIHAGIRPPRQHICYDAVISAAKEFGEPNNIIEFLTGPGPPKADHVVLKDPEGRIICNTHGGNLSEHKPYFKLTYGDFLRRMGQLEEQVVGHWVPAKKGNPGSFLLKPSDRQKFINWGKKKAKKKIEEGITTLRQELEVLRPRLAATAQQVYDAWVPDKQGWDEELGGGGPCDEIASALAGVITDSIDAHVDEGGHPGDDHAFLLVSRAGERYWVDIPPSVYEQGGGYSWRKVPDVQIGPEDIVIEPI